MREGTALPSGLVDRIAATLDSLAAGVLPLPFPVSVCGAVFSLPMTGGTRAQVLAVLKDNAELRRSVLEMAVREEQGPGSAPRPIPSLPVACMRLGHDKVARLAQEALIERLYTLPDSPWADQGALVWTRARVCAHIVRLLAESREALDAEQAYLCTLSCNLGEALVLRALAEIGAPVDPRLGKRVCEVIHERVGARFLSAWGASEVAVNLAAKHHAPVLMSESPAERELHKLVGLAWEAALQRVPLPAPVEDPASGSPAKLSAPVAAALAQAASLLGLPD